MDLAVLGSGPVGRTLAGAFSRLGHEVAIGTRDVDTTIASTGAEGWTFAGWQREHPTVALMPFAEAAKQGSIVLNAVNGVNALTTLTALRQHLADTILLDLALPLDLSRGLPPTLTVANLDSLGERLQAALPDTRVVKSLNTVHMSVMVDPRRVSGDHALFLSGNDLEAKQTIRRLLRELGWRAGQVIDLGGIETARSVEMYSALFFSLHTVLGTFDFNIAVSRG